MPQTAARTAGDALNMKFVRVSISEQCFSGAGTLVTCHIHTHKHTSHTRKFVGPTRNISVTRKAQAQRIQCTSCAAFGWLVCIYVATPMNIMPLRASTIIVAVCVRLFVEELHELHEASIIHGELLSAFTLCSVTHLVKICFDMLWQIHMYMRTDLCSIRYTPTTHTDCKSFELDFFGNKLACGRCVKHSLAHERDRVNVKCATINE